MKTDVQAAATLGALEKAPNRNAEINPEQLHVTTDDGKVTLAGTVGSCVQHKEADLVA